MSVSPISRLAMIVAVALASWAAPASAASPGVVEFPLPGDGSQAITAGPGGDLWFTAGQGSLGRIDADGDVTEIPLSGQAGRPRDITAGPDGNLWITTSRSVGRATPAGLLTEFLLPKADERPDQIVAGPDGNLWFTLWVPPSRPGGLNRPSGRAYIARITPNGAITKFGLPGRSRRRGPPTAIAAGPDGSVWFTDPAARRVGRVSPTGTIREHSLAVVPFGLATGADGDLWFTAPGAAAIGRISPAGKVREFSLRGREAARIAAGPDGNLWFTSSERRVGRITRSGQLTWFALSGGAGNFDIAAGPGVGVWVTTSSSRAKVVILAPIARISPGLPGLEVVSSAAVVRGGRAELKLACGGSENGCTGNITIGGRRRPIASTSYAVGPERRGRVSLLLPRRVRSLLQRKGLLREPVFADVAGGVATRARIALRAGPPLRGISRRARHQLLPLRTFAGVNGLIAFRSDAGSGADRGRHAIWVVAADGSGARRVTSGARPSGTAIDSSPVFFPGGRRLAYFSQVFDDDFVVSNQIYVKSVSAPARVAGSPVLARPVDFPILSFGISPDGRELVLAAQPPPLEETQIFTVGLNGGKLTQLTSGPMAASTPEFSPDGTKIIFARRIRGHGGIFTIHPDGSHLHQLTSRSGDGAPSYSPSGQRIVFNRHTKRHLRIFSTRADGGGAVALTDGPFFDRGPVFSPDGREIAFSRAGRGRNPDLYAMRADGSGLHLVYASRGRRISDFGPDWAGKEPRTRSLNTSSSLR